MFGGLLGGPLRLFLWCGSPGCALPPLQAVLWPCKPAAACRPRTAAAAWAALPTGLPCSSTLRPKPQTQTQPQLSYPRPLLPTRQMIFMNGLFGYLCILIVMKWATGSTADLYHTLIYMFLSVGWC